jgi:hypothetical protein
MLSNTALILLRDHANGRTFLPESISEIADVEHLEERGFVAKLRTRYYVTVDGVARLRLEAAVLVVHLTAKGMSAAEVRVRLKKLRLASFTRIPRNGTRPEGRRPRRSSRPTRQSPT